MNKKVILLIRDGWGYRKNCDDNAICHTHTPNTDTLMEECPNVLLDACGEAVGLPSGYQGNSEVGHMTIGSGRIMFQSLARINKSIKDKDFFKIPAFLDAIENCKKHGTKLHLIGLLQVEGVHAHLDHLFALLDLCEKAQFKNVIVHVITDGRDAPVTASLKHIGKLQDKLENLGFGEIATISGRYFTMDRDNRWDRIEKAYDCIVKGKSLNKFTDPIQAVSFSHQTNITDEFVIPICKDEYKGVKENDSIIFFNFRTDRTRQLTKAIVEEKFEGWNRKPLNVFYVGMTQFYNPMNGKVAFKDQIFDKLLGEVIANSDKKQLRISETEKYAHVTFFFNGQIEEPFKGEDRLLIQSPKVSTYDHSPEMSVAKIADKLIEEIQKDKYDLIVTNFVNGDMVGHTGIVPAIEKAVKAVDLAVGKVVNAALAKDYVILIFADHGNAEDQSDKWRTSHTINQVPLILVSNDPALKNSKLKLGKGLQDIAPTALKLLGIEKPSEMTGESIVN